MQKRYNNKQAELSAALKTIGIDRSASWFYKLFSGKYIENGVFTAGQDTIKLIAKALQDIESGRIALGVIPHTNTDIVKIVSNAIDAISLKGNVCKWLLISGTTGSQKSYSAKYYANTRDNCIYIESPSTASLPALVHRIGKAIHSPDSYSTPKKQTFIEDNIKEQHTIIVDNAQRMYEPRRGLTQQTFSFLQTLQDITNCSIVLIFVDEATGEDSLSRVMFGKDAGFFEQIIGRAGGRDKVLKLPSKTSDSDLTKFAKSCGFKGTEILKQILPILRFLSEQKGKLRIALNVLQDAARFASIENREINILDFLNEIPLLSLSDKQRIKIEALKTQHLALEV